MLLHRSDGRVVCTDTMVEGVHFRLDWSSPADVGWKLIAANVSDLWACGAEPRAWTLSMSVPSHCEPLAGLASRLADGVEEALQAFGVEAHLVGGDTTTSPSSLVLSVCMVGAVPEGRFLTRGGACAGDGIWLSGEPGWAAAGLHLLLSGGGAFEGVAARRALDAHRRPHPVRVPGSALVAGRVHAAIDLSDGLSSDLWHVALASEAALHVDRALLEAEALHEVPGATEELVERWLLGGGDDHVMAVVSADAPGPDWRRVGEVTRVGEADLILRDRGGNRRRLEPGGHRHF